MPQLLDPKAARLIPPEFRRNLQEAAEAVAHKAELQAISRSFQNISQEELLERRCGNVVFSRSERQEIDDLFSTHLQDRGGASKNFVFVKCLSDDDAIEGLLGRTDEVIAAFSNLVSHRGLIRSEARLMLHLSLGYKLNEESPIVSNSYESNRSLLKDMVHKLGVRGQQSLVALGYSLLSRDLGSQRNEKSIDIYIQELIRVFTQNGYARHSIHCQISRNEIFTPILEMGPVDGRPVLLIPTLRIPYLSTNHETQLFQHGIRFFLMLRPGSFCAPPLLTQSDYVSLVSEAIADFATAFSLERSLSLVFHGSAAKFFDSKIVDNPSVGRRIFFLPVVEHSGGSGPFRRLFKWFHETARKQNRLVELMVSALMKLCEDRRVFAKLARRLHADQTLDGRRVRGDFQCEKRLSFYHGVYQNCQFSVAADLAAGLAITPDEVTGLLNHSEVWFGEEFLRGMDDAFISGLHGTNSGSLTVIPDCGEYAGADAWEYLIQRL